VIQITLPGVHQRNQDLLNRAGEGSETFKDFGGQQAFRKSFSCNLIRKPGWKFLE